MIDVGPSLHTATGIRASDVVKYLESTGWTVRASRVKGIAIFSRTLPGADEPVHILLPTLPGFEEEHRRVADALRTIEAVEERPILTIIDQIFASQSWREVTTEPLPRKTDGDPGPEIFRVIEDGSAQTASVRLIVNGTAHVLSLDPRSSLLDVLREQLTLTGAKKGCDHGQCGACTVHLDGRAVVSCLTLAVQTDGRQVTTIEGLSEPDGKLHPMQQAFVDHDALQCGYCTPGQIMAAVACVRQGYATSPDQIREYMSGNICRCGAYVGIVAAIREVASKIRET
jgi:xanthine dehydrogenase YagT iron-sulfur-binding subunit